MKPFLQVLGHCARIGARERHRGAGSDGAADGMAHPAHAEQRHRRDLNPSMPATVLGAPGLPFPGRRKRLAARSKRIDFRLPQPNRPLNAILASIFTKTIRKNTYNTEFCKPETLHSIITARSY